MGPLQKSRAARYPLRGRGSPYPGSRLLRQRRKSSANSHNLRIRRTFLRCAPASAGREHTRRARGGPLLRSNRDFCILFPFGSAAIFRYGRREAVPRRAGRSGASRIWANPHLGRTRIRPFFRLYTCPQGGGLSGRRSAPAPSDPRSGSGRADPHCAAPSCC